MSIQLHHCVDQYHKHGDSVLKWIFAHSGKSFKWTGKSPIFQIRAATLAVSTSGVAIPSWIFYNLRRAIQERRAVTDFYLSGGVTESCGAVTERHQHFTEVLEGMLRVLTEAKMNRKRPWITGNPFELLGDE